MVKKISFLLLLLFFLHSTLGFSQVDPHIEWMSLRLPHFDLVYDARYHELAQIWAARLEGSYLVLQKYFPLLEDRPVVVITDQTDQTNGFSTPVPYPLIQIYPALPGPLESIGEYGDWFSEMFTHELTHTLAIEPRRGVIRGLQYVFGSIMVPNLLLPRWWNEGLAVETETRFSRHGRLRSSYQEASLRALYRDGQWKDLDLSEINESLTPSWPGGARPYLYGSLMMSAAVARRNLKALGDLAWEYSGRVPYFITAPAEDILGTDYQDLFNEMKVSVTALLQRQFQELKRIPPSKTTAFDTKIRETVAPAISPNGLRLALISRDETLRRSVQVYERPNNLVPFTPEHLLKSADEKKGEAEQGLRAPTPRLQEDGPTGGSLYRVSWFPDSKRVVYDRLTPISWFHEAFDLYQLDVVTGKVERLTRNLRAREPVVSPNGQKIAFSQMDAGRTSLALLDLSTKKVEILFRPGWGERVSYPVFLNDNEILFSLHQAGHDHLQKWSRLTKRTTALPVPVDDIRFLEVRDSAIFFTGTQNGVNNIYQADLSLKKIKPLSHTLTGLMTSAWDEWRRDLYATELSGHGFQIVRIDSPESQRLPQHLPKPTPLFANRYPAVDPPVAKIQAAQPEDYSSWKYLLPRYWLPFYYSDQVANYYSLTTSGGDPLQKHSYQIYGMYDDALKQWSYGATYNNLTTAALISAKASQLNTFLINRSNLVQITNQSLSAQWQILSLAPEWTAGLGWNWGNRNFYGLQSNLAGPSIFAAYSDIWMAGAQISPERGQAAQLTYTEFLPGSNQENFRLLELSYNRYFSGWLPERHALLFRGQGQYIDRGVSGSNFAYTSAYPLTANGSAAQYLLRGYPQGQLQGKSLATTTFEYRFPVASVYQGSGTFPVFSRRWHMALVADGATVDGYSYNPASLLYERVPLQKWLWSYGGEIKWDITLGYHIPTTLYLGAYQPTDGSSGPQFGFGIFL